MLSAFYAKIILSYGQLQCSFLRAALRFLTHYLTSSFASWEQKEKKKKNEYCKIFKRAVTCTSLFNFVINARAISTARRINCETFLFAQFHVTCLQRIANYDYTRYKPRPMNNTTSFSLYSHEKPFVLPRKVCRCIFSASTWQRRSI